VIPLAGRSDRIIPTLTGPFDIIYIDGSHLYDCVRADLAAAEHLLADGGFLCGDDLEAQGYEVEDTVLAANAGRDAILLPRGNRTIHPGVTRAVAEHFGLVSVYRGFWIMQRRGRGYAPVSLAGAEGWLPRHWDEDNQRRIMTAVEEDGILSRLL
jgi:hypothetical protein